MSKLFIPYIRMNVGSFASFVVTCNRGESMHTSSEEPMGLHALPEDSSLFYEPGIST